MFVLDEADEMLSRGFKDQIYDVFRYMPQDIQVMHTKPLLISPVLRIIIYTAEVVNPSCKHLTVELTWPIDTLKQLIKLKLSRHKYGLISNVSRFLQQFKRKFFE